MGSRPIFILIIFSMWFLIGCFPVPMFSDYTTESPSPDGKTDLKFTSRTWHGVAFIGPEPPKITSCKASIKGYPKDGDSFKITINQDFVPSLMAQDRCDIVWSRDSEFFAVQTPFDLTVYDRKGAEVIKYALSPKERISTTHWRKDKEHGLYVVIKKDKNDLSPRIDDITPAEAKIISTSIDDKSWKDVLSINYTNSWKFNSFVKNDLTSKIWGQEFQEISPDSRCFLYSNGRMIRTYNFVEGNETVLFDSPGLLAWIWWINNSCILFDFYVEGWEVYRVYNMTSGKQEDLSQQINSLSYKERYNKDWYKSISCP